MQASRVRATVLFTAALSVTTALIFSAISLYPQATAVIAETINAEKPMSPVELRNDALLAQTVAVVFWGALLLFTGATWVLTVSPHWYRARYAIPAIATGMLTALVGLYAPVLYAVGALDILVPGAPAAGALLAEEYATLYRANLEQAYYLAGVLTGGIIGVMVLIARYSVTMHAHK
jgi:hypothetical protein